VSEPRAFTRESAGPTGGQVLPFRRRTLKRRKRSLALALLKPLAGALVLVGAPVAIAAWALTSPRFALAEVAVAGSGRVPRDWIRAQLAPLLGRNLLLLPLGEVDRALAGHPWIAAVEVSKRLPATLAVAVAERAPAALLRVGGAPWFADAQGRPIAPVAASDDGGAPAGDLLLVSRAAGAGEPAPGDVQLALRLAAELGASRPEWAAELTAVEVISDDDARLHSAALPCPLVVTAGRVEPAARRLAELLPELLRRYGTLAAVDLRFSGRIVVEPGTAGPTTAAAVEEAEG
jgi:cell division protein FtsQ